MLKQTSTALVIVDVQGKLAQAMHEKDQLIQKIKQSIRGAQALNLPIVWIEQYPKGLGSTTPEVAELLTNLSPLEKTTFSAWGNANIVEHIQSLNVNQLVVCGIESHICVYQSVIDFLNNGFHVEVIEDAISSRTLQNKQIGLNKMHQAGAQSTCTEMWLFELLQDAKHPCFRDIQAIIK